MKLFTLIKTDLKSFILLAISIVLSLIGMIMYIVTTKQMNTHISPLMLIVSIIGLLCLLEVIIYRDFDGIITIIGAAAELLALGLFVSSQMGNLGYYFAGIQDIGYGIMSAFVVGGILYILSVVTTSVAAFLEK